MYVIQKNCFVFLLLLCSVVMEKGKCKKLHEYEWNYVLPFFCALFVQLT